jgi:endoglucanase
MILRGSLCSGLAASARVIACGIIVGAVGGCGGEGTATRESGAGALNPAVAPTVTGTATSAWAAPDTVDPNSPVGRSGALHVAGTLLVDASGTPVRLKGVSTMWLNWEQSYASSKDGLRWLRDNWGLSVIRAAMGVEPAGSYLDNPAPMIADVRNVVHNAIDLGVYVIIDWHDHHGEMHQPQATDFFSKMAEEFGQYPNVLYETYNEPMKVDWATVLKPYHVAVSGAIREKDPDNVIIMGTPVWSQQVNNAADDPVPGTNQMYTVHFYSCDHKAQQRAIAQYAHDHGAPIFVTEWGATKSDGGTDPTVPLCTDEAQAWHDFLDANMISWTAWKLDDCADLSCLFKPQAPTNGGWTDEWLNGHGPFVRDHMLAPNPVAPPTPAPQ